MTEFIVRYLICNIAICIIIGILLLCKRACKHVLTGRMQYHLWLILLGLLLIPFYRFRYPIPALFRGCVFLQTKPFYPDSVKADSFKPDLTLVSPLLRTLHP